MANSFYDEFIGTTEDAENLMPEGGSLKPTPFIGPAMAGIPLGRTTD